MNTDDPLKYEHSDKDLRIPRILNELQLIYARSGSWFLIFQDSHDFILNDEPYFSLNMLYDCNSHQFVWRVLGRTVEKGQIESEDHFTTTCQRLFHNRKPCLGIKPKDARFPLSCRFSSTCAITVDSQASKLDVCLECQKLFLPSKTRPSKAQEDEGLDPDYDSTYKEEVGQEEIGSDFDSLEAVDPGGQLQHGIRTNKKTIKEANRKRQTWTCRICHKVLNFASSETHLRNVHGAAEFNCLICFESFPFAKELTDHNFLVHSQNSTLECPNCQIMIDLGDDGDGLISHVEVCNRAKFVDTLPKSKGKQEGQIHQCDQCGKEFATGYLLKSHQKTHSDVWLECKTCEFKTKYKQNLINHERRHVQGRGTVKNCICDLCGKALRGPECLDKHIKSIHEKSLHFPCDKCDRAFTSSAMLKRHKNRFHAESDEFICKVCSYRAGDHIELSDHSKVHEDPTHKCQYCTKLFRRKHHLTIHERIHKGEKPFKCDICDYASNNSGNLIKHKKFVHQQQKKTAKKSQFQVEQNSSQMIVDKPLSMTNQHLLSQQGPSIFAMMEIIMDETVVPGNVSLEQLNNKGLSYHKVRNWIFIFRSDFDLIADIMEPYLAMTLMVHEFNFGYVGRVMGRIALSGSMESLGKDLLGLCDKFFINTKPCLGFQPIDDLFPNSCQFSDQCFMYISNSKMTSESSICQECLRLSPNIETSPSLVVKFEEPKTEDGSISEEIDDILTDFKEEEPGSDTSKDIQSDAKIKKTKLNKNDGRSCRLCGAHLKSLSSLCAHMTLVHFRAYFDCIHCDAKFRFAKELTNHLLAVHPKTLSANCPKCLKLIELEDELTLADHHEICVREHTRQKVTVNRFKRIRRDRPHQCDQCGKSYSLIEYLKNHKKKHGEPIKCSKCDFATTSNQYLKEHEKKHLVEEGLAPKAICHLCGKELSQNTSLKNHIKFVHGQLNFPCEKCDRVFTREKTLTAHKNRVHGESDKFLCGECGYRAGSQMELRDHSRTHDDTLHKCRLCGKLMKSRRTLQNHERLHKENGTFLTDITLKP
ncbi:zinc finger protein 91-like [Tigriopus californicus]|uniref:zinc finger protein 91-like n=1 Tax=Tigriopus californicus TaxID=6832 RepID=UPI0027DA2CD1|nr:zinc finger protein 91-like [Tigriopus californicus]